jgi:hypothetical protein
MMKTLPIVVAVIGALAAPAAADRARSSSKPQPQPPPAAGLLDITKKPALGADYDLKRRDHKSTMPTDSATQVAKVRTVTEAQVGQVVKIRRGEVEYCWDRLPPSQRIAGTAVMHFTIAPEGKVAAIEMTGDAPSEAASCLAETAKRWTFPVVDAESLVEFPIWMR